MSLLRLLTAGKSLVGLKDAAHRYNLARRGSLPKFNSKRNPFRATARPEPVSRPQEPMTAASGVAETGTPKPSVAEGAALAPTPAPAGTPMKRFPGAKSGARLFSFLPWMRPPVVVPIPRASKSMIQAELSLDAVRVVRNDLSDSDLEVLSTKKRPKAAPELCSAPTAPSMPAESAWNRVTRQFFGAGRT
jgi:hypothetical protein